MTNGGAEFAIGVRDEAGVTVIAVRGDADLHNTPQLKQRIAGEIEGGARRFVIDLSGTTLIDSTMLGVLVGALKHTRDVAGLLALVAPPPETATVFAITGLDRVFAIYDDPDQAIRALAN